MSARCLHCALGTTGYLETRTRYCGVHSRANVVSSSFKNVFFVYVQKQQNIYPIKSGKTCIKQSRPFLDDVKMSISCRFATKLDGSGAGLTGLCREVSRVSHSHVEYIVNIHRAFVSLRSTYLALQCPDVHSIIPTNEG